MKFLHPEMARWLLLIPAVCAFWGIHYLYKCRVRIGFGDHPRLRALSRMSSAGHDCRVLGLGLLTTTCLAVALMRPQVWLKKQVPEFDRQDLILMLDRSLSMGAQDISPSRFARAKLEIRNFLKSKPEAIDRVGLVTFAGTSVILSHLTRDVESLLFFLDWVEEDPQPIYGTDLGAALNSAMEIARKDQIAQKKKIFLMLSDGEDHGERLNEALNAFQQDRARVYAIGIGSESDVVIPIRAGKDGVEQSFLVDENGNIVRSRFDEGTLRWIATSTGGQYFRSVSGNELTAVMNDIVSHEQKIIGWKTAEKYQDIYHWLLLSAGVVLLFLLMSL